MHARVALVVLLSCPFATKALGGFTYVSSFAQWQAFAPVYTTIDFTDLQKGEWLSDQYLDLGVNFIDGGFAEQSSLYPQDSFGVYGACYMDIAFDSPQYAIGSHHPGSMRFDIYFGSTLLYTSLSTGSGLNNFRGVLSTQPFDRVVMRGDTLGPPSCDPISVDNIYFSSVPGPGALPLLALGCLGRGRRRR
jgi:MYXO-CTERM domain-containing protein